MSNGEQLIILVGVVFTVFILFYILDAISGPYPLRDRDYLKNAAGRMILGLIFCGWVWLMIFEFIKLFHTL